MNLARLIWRALIITCVLPIASEANPLFQWLEPWQPVFVPAGVTGTLIRLDRNFGQTATTDGQITDVGSVGDIGPSTAFARAVIAFGAPPDSDGAVQVIFTRQFQLSGSPAGWTVSLSGFLAGLLVNITNASTTNSDAHVNVEGDILQGMAPTGIDIFYQQDLQNRNGFGSEGGTGSGPLSDGIYIARGELTVAAAEAGTGQAISNFFDNAAGFSMTVDATAVGGVAALPINIPLFAQNVGEIDVSAQLPPVPEPATTWLILPPAALVYLFRRRLIRIRGVVATTAIRV